MVSQYINRENLDRASPVPLHYQVQELLRKAIADGIVKVGEALPPEETLAAEAGISRATVRQAMAQLVREGLLHRRRGKGTFVSEPPLQFEFIGPYSFTRDIARQTDVQEVRVLRIGLFPLAEEMRHVFGPDAPDQGVQIVRLRLVQGVPVALETLMLQAVDPTHLDQTAGDDRTLYEMLERDYGYAITHAEETLGMTTVDAETAALLDLRAGATVFFLERRTAAGNRPVELRHSYIRAEGFRFHAGLDREHLMQ